MWLWGVDMLSEDEKMVAMSLGVMVDIGTLFFLAMAHDAYRHRRTKP
jgi:hypothetical protein